MSEVGRARSQVRGEVEALKRPTMSEKTHSNARNQLDECYNDRERRASTE
jgi:hypothetical protein